MVLAVGPAAVAPVDAAGRLERVTSGDASEADAGQRWVRPARSATAWRWLAAGAVALLAVTAFAAALPLLAAGWALLAGVVLAVPVAVTLRWAVAASQARLGVTPEGIAVVRGLGSGLVSWSALESLVLVRRGRRVGVEVMASSRLRPRVPPVFPEAAVRAWLDAAAATARERGVGELVVDDRAGTDR